MDEQKNTYDDDCPQARVAKDGVPIRVDLDLVFHRLDIEFPRWRTCGWGETIATHTDERGAIVFYVASPRLHDYIYNPPPDEPWERAVWLVRTRVPVPPPLRPGLSSSLWDTWRFSGARQREGPAPQHEASVQNRSDVGRREPMDELPAGEPVMLGGGLLAILDAELPTWRTRAWGETFATHAHERGTAVFYVNTAAQSIEPWVRAGIAPAEPWVRAAWVVLRNAYFLPSLRPELGRRLWDALHTREPDEREFTRDELLAQLKEEGARSADRLRACVGWENECLKLTRKCAALEAELDAMRARCGKAEAAIAALYRAYQQVHDVGDALGL